MKKRFGPLLFVVLVLSAFALLTTQNVQAERQLPLSEPDRGLPYAGLEGAPAKVSVKASGAPVSREPQAGSATDNLAWLLAGLAGVALMGLYALNLLMS